jgi:hypothetical protein
MRIVLFFFLLFIFMVVVVDFNCEHGRYLEGGITGGLNQ